MGIFCCRTYFKRKLSCQKGRIYPFHQQYYSLHVDRLVDCLALKKSVDLLYAKYLLKGTHSFVYLSLQIKPQNVDVNVHPTKRQVNFLNQDEIIESLCSKIEEKLASCTKSRGFAIQVIFISQQDNPYARFRAHQKGCSYKSTSTSCENGFENEDVGFIL